MDVTTQESKEQTPLNRVAERAAGGSSEKNSSPAESSPPSLAFELESCLEEAIEEWRALNPRRRLIKNYEDQFNDPLVGDADVLQSLLQSMLRRIALGSFEGSIRFTLKRDHLFSSETHAAFSMSLEDRNRPHESVSEEETATLEQEVNLSRQLIQKLGGELRIENLRPQGLKLAVRLRFAKATLPLIDPENCLDGVRVLVVDDDSMSRMLTASMLRSLKAQVVTARHGQEALELAAKQPFDMLFLDIEMPVMDGVTTCQGLRNIPGYESVPVLALTSHEQEEQHAYYLERGMQDVMVKPVDKNTIINAVELYLMGRRNRPKMLGGQRPSTEEGSKPALVDFDESGELAEGSESSHYWIDAPQLRDAFDESREVLELCITVFAKRYPALLDEVEVALAKHDALSTSRAAHELKGMLANLWAPKLSALAADIEDWARDGRLSGSDQRLNQLRHWIPFCVQELQETVKTWPEDDEGVI